MSLTVFFRAKPFAAIVLSAIVFGLLGLGAPRILPAPHAVSLAITINQPPRAETAEYSYDGYYALRASELFADTLISWFGTPSFVADVYRAAELPVPERLLQDTRRFRAKKYSSQSVVLSFSEPDRPAAERLANAFAAVASDRTAELNLDAEGRPLFTLRADPPSIGRGGLTPLRTAIVGALLGAAAGYALAFASARKKPEAA